MTDAGEHLARPGQPERKPIIDQGLHPKNEDEKDAFGPSGTVTEDRSSDITLVDFEENDAENPLNWSSWRKWLIVFAVAWMDFVSVFATVTIIPTAPQILQEFHSHNNLKRTLLVCIWELGEGTGPFFIAPMAERFGRLPVFHIGNLLALLCLIACALSVNISMLIAFRCLCGFFLPILTLSPAIVGDLFNSEQLGRPMALLMGPQIVANFISAVAGSYIAQSFGWRWAVWLATIVFGAFSLLLIVVLRETYAVKILKQRASRLEHENPGRKYQSKFQARINASTALENITKPVQILARSPAATLITLYIAIAYALVLLILTTLTETMESTYPSTFSRGSIGLTFLSLAIGTAFGVLFYSLTSDRYVARKKKIRGAAFRPESRLAHLLLGAVVLPLGFLIYGWGLAFHVHYIVPLIGTCAIGFSILLSGLSTDTYLVEIYDINGASALASGVILRTISGALLPLVGPPLYNALGLGWGNSVLALLGAVFIPPLVLLMRYGDWFRGGEGLQRPLETQRPFLAEKTITASVLGKYGAFSHNAVKS